MNTEIVPRFTPPTPRSRRLGRALRTLREQAGLTLDTAGEAVGCSPSRISRIESGEIKSKPGAVIEILMAYGVAIDDERGRDLVALARDLRKPGWWSRLDLSTKYATFVSYEAESSAVLDFEPVVIPGLLQVESYARAIISSGHPDDPAAVDGLVSARMTRQELLRRKPPLRLHAVIGEPALRCQIGDDGVMAEQAEHLRRVARLPNVHVTVLPYSAGPELADSRGFQVLLFAKGEPNLAYEETAAHELFVERPADVARLVDIHERLSRASVPITRFV